MIEKVSEYPRPPKLQEIQGEVRIIHKKKLIVESTKYIRILEKFHAPTIYIPRYDFFERVMQRSNTKATYCEWKGFASYWNICLNGQSILIANAGWSYDQPTAQFLPLIDHIAIYSHLVDECWLEGERVSHQGGEFYGGWVTRNVEGPYKGDPLHPELI